MIWIKEGNIEITGTVKEVKTDYTITTKAVRNVRQVLDVLEQAAGIAGFRIKSIEIQDRTTKERFRRRG